MTIIVISKLNKRKSCIFAKKKKKSTLIKSFLLFSNQGGEGASKNALYGINNCIFRAPGSE